MAPQNKDKQKRESSSEANDEVCKRLKQDLKEPKGDEQDTKDVKDDKHNNNNGSDKNLDVAKEEENSSKEETSPHVNGAQKDETQTKKKDSNNKADDEKPKKTSETKVEKAETKSSPDSKVEDEEESTSGDEQHTGTLLICGGANWEMTGRKELPKNAKKSVDAAARNLWGPNKVLSDSDGKVIRVKGVFSGCNACHSVIVTEDGDVMTFGRNDKGQLGLGDTGTRVTPTVIEAFKGVDIVSAACGRSHTIFLDSEGRVYACGDNKMGQCGTNQQSVQQILSPARIAFKEDKPIVKVACGAEFSMIVDKNGKLYSFGHPEHGQLGHNSEGKYFTSGNKYAFHCEYAPRRIVTFIEKSREGHVSPVDDVFITDIACGTNHTLAVDKKNRCYSWGFAGYHRLGHSETKNELVPRSIKVFEAPNDPTRGAAKVFAGASFSMALDVNGLLYFWGQNKSSGEATMYPKNVQDLCGYKISALSCANRSIFVITDDVCVSWGPSPTYGELGYGEGKSKSSTVPQEVKTLAGVEILDVACGFGHTLLIARDKTTEDKALLEKLESWP